jgi:hypothetical protein
MHRISKAVRLAAGAGVAYFAIATRVFAQAIIQNPLSSNSLCGFIKNILSVVLAIGIPVVMLFIVYAGSSLSLRAVTPRNLEKAKRNFMYVIIGTLVFLGAWVLGQIIANTINNISQGERQQRAYQLLDL